MRGRRRRGDDSGGRTIVPAVATVAAVLLFGRLVSAADAFVRVPRCNDKALELREDDADVVVTGVVRRIYGEPVGYSCAVEIVRVLKGGDALLALPNVSAPLYHRVVRVAGFGNPRICDSQVDANDTRIFLLSRNLTSLHLNSSVVRISLSALRKAQAAVDGVGVRDPCDGMTCDFGSVCMPSADGQSARCHCPDRCESVGDASSSVAGWAVCGSDGKDYGSMCELRRQGCLSLTNLHVIHKGKCDPCKGVACRPLQKCMLTSDRRPVCGCNDTCPVAQGGDAVCGNDGATYDSECELRVAACHVGNVQLAVLHPGPCQSGANPCEAIACANGAICVVSPSTRMATCQCPPLCPHVNLPVCGSDSVTYDNECHLRRESCLQKKDISIVASMTCSSMAASCVGVLCPHGAECVPGVPASRGSSGTPYKCICPTCTAEPQPVCGSDGVTYTNDCHMRAASCRNKVDIVVERSGACDICKDVKCDFHAVCESRGGKAQCVCPAACVQVVEPVCGSDGQMYNNQCELMVTSCTQQKTIAVMPEAYCSPTERPCLSECRFGSVCQAGTCQCVEDLDCPAARVTQRCGSDGVTYNRSCEMNAAICRKQEGVYVVHDGPCGSSPQELGSGDDGAQDGREGSGEGYSPTYQPGVSDSTNLPLRCSESTCKFGGICSFHDSLSGRCHCEFTTCDGYREKVCGSDGVIYKTICELRLSSCRQQKAIEIRPLASCPGGTSVINGRPCEGAATPLTDLFGRDLDCSHRNGKCPEKSYCHRTEKFAKCCPDDPSIPPSCMTSEFGCCPDKKTPSPGPRFAGCPSRPMLNDPATCFCNVLGSLRQTCDPISFQCDCKRGVGGQRCDACQPGWWGLNRINDQQPGCEPCQCNAFGSQRQDCEQNTGKCLCHSFATGLKCDRCVRAGFELTAGGCKPFQGASDNIACANISCVFGVCTINRQTGRSHCSCDLGCAAPSFAICGNDRRTYNSECQMQEHSCQIQQHVTKLHDGPCREATATTVRHLVSGSTVHTTKAAASTAAAVAAGFPGSTAAFTAATSPPRAEPDPSSSSDFEFEKEKTGGTSATPISGSSAAVATGGRDDSSTTTASSGSSKPTCDSNPCGKGLCRPDDVFGFVCECFVGSGGVDCSEERSFTHPYFNGRSFLELTGLPGPEKTVQIDMDFLPAEGDGVLLYSSNSLNGSGDFLSVVLKSSFVEFRFDNGHGALVLRSAEPIQVGAPHRLTVRKDGLEGMLLIDSRPPVYGKAPGSLTSLNVSPRVYLGHIPRDAQPLLKTGIRLLQSVGSVQSGYIGCITSLEATGASKRVYGLSYPNDVTHVLRGLNIDQCQSDPCLENPCINGGVCKTLQNGAYHCTCPKGFHGVNCAARTKKTRHATHNAEPTQQPRTSIDVPQFLGDSYIKQNVITSLVFDFFLEIWFRTFKPEGTLLWVGRRPSPNAGGDFLRIYVERNQMRVSFDVGNGRMTLRSNETLSDDQGWHTVKVRREGQKMTMSVDDNIVSISDKGKFTHLNVENSVYVGGIPGSSRPGFHGVVQKLVVNKEIFEDLFHDADIVHGVELYRGPPCHPNPCLAGALCLPELNEFRCVYP